MSKNIQLNVAPAPVPALPTFLISINKLLWNLVRNVCLSAVTPTSGEVKWDVQFGFLQYQKVIIRARSSRFWKIIVLVLLAHCTMFRRNLNIFILKSDHFLLTFCRPNLTLLLTKSCSKLLLLEFRTANSHNLIAPINNLQIKTVESS